MCKKRKCFLVLSFFFSLFVFFGFFPVVFYSLDAENNIFILFFFVQCPGKFNQPFTIVPVSVLFLMESGSDSASSNESETEDEPNSRMIELENQVSH